MDQHQIDIKCCFKVKYKEITSEIISSPISKKKILKKIAKNYELIQTNPSKGNGWYKIQKSPFKWFEFMLKD